MVWIGRDLKDPLVPTGASQLKMATVLQGHKPSSISLCISLNTGIIWTGFLSRFRENGCVSFGLCCGVDCITLEKQESQCLGLLGQGEKSECSLWLHANRLEGLSWAVLCVFPAGMKDWSWKCSLLCPFSQGNGMFFWEFILIHKTVFSISIH